MALASTVISAPMADLGALVVTEIGASTNWTVTVLNASGDVVSVLVTSV
jgi:hypothetical protein